MRDANFCFSIPLKIDTENLMFFFLVIRLVDRIMIFFDSLSLQDNLRKALNRSVVGM